MTLEELMSPGEYLNHCRYMYQKTHFIEWAKELKRLDSSAHLI